MSHGVSRLALRLPPGVPQHSLDLGERLIDGVDLGREHEDLPGLGGARRCDAFKVIDALGQPSEAERVALSACDMDGRTFIDQQDRWTTTWRCGATTTP
jgi:hypothetical protein